MIEDRIPVQIFGQTYEILGNASESLYYTSLARAVENKMKEIMESSNIVSTQKIAVLAALNIADELFRERENKSLSGKNLEKKQEEWVRLLNRALQEPVSEPAPSGPALPAGAPAPAPVPAPSEELSLS